MDWSFPFLFEEAVEHLLPILAEPRVSAIGVGGQGGHVVVEAGNILGLELDRDGALGLLLEALDELDLPAPTVAGQPLEWLAQVRPPRSLEDPSRVLGTREQHHGPRVRLLAQSLDYVVEHAIVGRARHFDSGGYAHVALGRLPREHLDPVFAVTALRVHGRDVGPVGALHHVDQRDRLERVRWNRPREIVEPDDRPAILKIIFLLLVSFLLLLLILSVYIL